jgi:hypothetical protein
MVIFDMSKRASDDQYSEQETQRRLDAVLRGAFSGPPTPLKNIPKKSGESRAQRKDQRPRRRQRKNRAA